MEAEQPNHLNPGDPGSIRTSSGENEQAQQQRHEIYRHIVECLPDFIDRYLPGGVLTFVNESLAKFTGFAAEDLLGKSFYPFIHETDREEVIRLVESISVENPTVVTEGRLVMPDGRMCWTRWTHEGFFAENGAIVAYQSVGKDITEQKAAEEARKESEEKYRSIVEKSADWIWEMDLNGIHTFSNRNVIDILGFSAEEFVGQSALSLLHDEDRVRIEAELPSLIAGKQGWRGLVLRWRHKDGSYHHLESNADPILDSMGEIRGYRGIDRDITARINYEDMLRESEERFKKVLQDVQSIAVQGYGPDGTTQYWNKASENLYGYSAAEAIGRNLIDLIIPPEMQDDVKKAIRFMAESGQPIPSSELNLLRKDGTLVPVFSSHVIIKIPDHNQELFCLDIDLSERKRSEAALQASEERFRSIMALSPDIISIISKEGNLLYNSPAALQIHGYTQEDMAGISTFELIHPEDQKKVQQVFVDILNNPSKTGSVQYRYRNKNGTYVWMECSALNQLENPLINGVIAISRNIDDRKQLEEERLHLEQQILHAQKLESLGILAGGIAHDFNNILTAIVGNAELGLMQLDSASPAVENLRRIELAAARAADLAKQMLAYSGKGKLLVEHLNLNRLLEEMLHMLEVSISKKVHLRFNRAPDLPSIDADATQLRQIVMNLVINASEAIGDQSGTIAVNTGCMRYEQYSLQHTFLAENITDGRYVYIEIADSGCGMDQETLAKIFDPFFTTKFTGRGLGMAAVLGIVRGHKGVVQISSEVQQGTTFRILLPVSEHRGADAMSEPENSTWEGAAGTVLLVDDEEAVLGIGCEMLKKLGLTPIPAKDGQEAVNLFKDNADIDLVILDLTMPTMDGLQCYQELVQYRPDTKIIISSGYSEYEITEKFAGRGLAGVIQKPYTFSTLRKVLAKHALCKDD